MVGKVDIRVVNADILTLKSDALALKYAQANYGVDRTITRTLKDAGWNIAEIRPRPGDYRLLKNPPNIGARLLLFIGVVPLYQFGYREIRDFARRSLVVLAADAPDVETLTVTLHGAGYGLDEAESLVSELAGLWDAISSHNCPPRLQQISIVERNAQTCERLESVLSDIFPAMQSRHTADGDPTLATEKSERLRTAGYASDSKPHIFVAMPFRQDMDDVYHYGIQGAARKAGFLCERADLSAFTGDVMQWVRSRIRSASLVVADLSDGNPNVYLEVGYAWGCGKRTVLLAKDTKQLLFDVQGQRCIVYNNIRDLEGSLAHELKNLRETTQM